MPCVLVYERRVPMHDSLVCLQTRALVAGFVTSFKSASFLFITSKIPIQLPLDIYTSMLYSVPVENY